MHLCCCLPVSAIPTRACCIFLFVLQFTISSAEEFYINLTRVNLLQQNNYNSNRKLEIKFNNFYLYSVDIFYRW